MAALCYSWQQLVSGVHCRSELVRRRDAGCSTEAAVDIQKSVAAFLVGVCVVHIHQRYPEALQCRALVLTLEILWVALVNMYNTDTNKKHCNRLLDIHGGFLNPAWCVGFSYPAAQAFIQPLSCQVLTFSWILPRHVCFFI